MDFEHLKEAYEKRHPSGRLFAELPPPKGRYRFFGRRGRDGILTASGLVDGHEVCDALPEVPGFYPQAVTRLFLSAETLLPVVPARPRLN